MLAVVPHAALAMPFGPTMTFVVGPERVDKPKLTASPVSAQVMGFPFPLLAEYVATTVPAGQEHSAVTPMAVTIIDDCLMDNGVVLDIDPACAEPAIRRNTAALNKWALNAAIPNPLS